MDCLFVCVFIFSIMVDLRRNIFYFIVDDLGKCLGCYGVKGVKMFNIDVFVVMGVVFDCVFISIVLCSFSCIVMYIGFYFYEFG